MPAPLGFTTLTSAATQDAAGNLLTGTLEIVPTDGNDNPITARAGGAGGQITTTPAIVQVVGGAITGPIIAPATTPAPVEIPDTSLTVPTNLSYRFTLKDSSGKIVSVLKGVQPSGSTWSLDTFDPNVPAQAAYVAGLPGQSAYQAWLSLGNTGTVTQFIASLQGSSGLNSRGIFAAGNSYSPHDLVTYQGSVYLCNVATGGSSVSTPSVNLFDQTGVAANNLVNDTNGTLTPYSGFTASGFIDLMDPATGTVASSWTTNNVVGAAAGASEGVAYYSAPNLSAYVGGDPDPAGTGTNSLPPTTVQNPHGYRYMRFNIAPTGADIPLSQTMVVRGPTLPSAYVAFGSTSSGGGAAVPTDTTHWSLFLQGTTATPNASSSSSGIVAVRASLPKNRPNIFDLNEITNNSILSATGANAGQISTLAGYIVTGRMDVFGATMLASNLGFGAYLDYGLCFTDGDDVLIKGISQNSSGTENPPTSTVYPVPAGAVFARGYSSSALYPAGGLAAVMVVTDASLGTPGVTPVLPTTYVPFYGNPAPVAGPLLGQTAMLFGDSYSAGFGPVWQGLFTAATGCTFGVQRIQSGRHLYEIFTEYVSGGVLNTAALTADLAAASFVIIYLATNDVLSGILTGAVSLGAITDTPVVPLNIQGTTTTIPGSLYAYAQGAVDQVDALAPTLPKIIVGALHMDRIAGTPIIPGGYDYTTSNASTDIVNGCLATVAASRGHYFVDMAALVGINKQNVQTYPASGSPQPLMLRDNVHPTNNLGFPRVAQQISAAALRVFGY